MLISIISSEKNIGSSTLSVSLGYELSSLKNNVLITNTSQTSDKLYSYLGIKHGEENKFAQSFLNLVKSNVVDVSSVKDYAKEIRQGLDAFIPNEIGNPNDLKDLIVALKEKKDPYEIVIVNIDTDLSEPLAHEILSASDLIIINISQNTYTNKSFMESNVVISNAAKMGAGVIFTCSIYDKEVSSVKQLSKDIKIKSRVYSLPYSPFIKKMSNSGKLLEYYDAVVRKDARVVELQPFLKKLTLAILRRKG